MCIFYTETQTICIYIHTHTYYLSGSPFLDHKLSPVFLVFPSIFSSSLPPHLLSFFCVPFCVCLPLRLSVYMPLPIYVLLLLLCLFTICLPSVCLVLFFSLPSVLFLSIIFCISSCHSTSASLWISLFVLFSLYQFLSLPIFHCYSHFSL